MRPDLSEVIDSYLMIEREEAGPSEEAVPTLDDVEAVRQVIEASGVPPTDDQIRVLEYYTDKDPFYKLTDLVGHWTVERLPSQLEMAKICGRTCYEKQLLRARKQTPVDGHHHNTRRFVALCRSKGGSSCSRPVAPAPDSDCAYDVVDSVLCDEWQDVHSLCDQALGDPAKLYVTHTLFTEMTASKPSWLVPLKRNTRNLPLFEAVLSDNDDDCVARDASAELVNFDVRPKDHFRILHTSDEGDASFRFVASVGKRENEVEQVVSVSPFLFANGLKHTFVETRGTGAEDPRNEDPTAPKVKHHHSIVIDHFGVGATTFTDNSTHPITGRVLLSNLVQTVGNGVLSSDIDRGVDLAGDCPVGGVKVCAFEVSPGGSDVQGEQVDCYTTAADGKYVLMAPEGSTVVIAPAKDGRVFRSQMPEVKKMEAAGVTDIIQVDSGFPVELVPAINNAVEGLDIVDITAMRPWIEFGAGSCLTYMGGFVLKFTARASGDDGLPISNPQCDIGQVSFSSHKQRMSLPAQDYDVELVEVRSEEDLEALGATPIGSSDKIGPNGYGAPHWPKTWEGPSPTWNYGGDFDHPFSKTDFYVGLNQQILDYFNGTTSSTELLTVPGQETLVRVLKYDGPAVQASKTKAADGTFGPAPPVALVRFEYHVVPSISLSCAKCESPEFQCSDPAVTDPDPPFFIMKSESEYTIDVALKEAFYQTQNVNFVEGGEGDAGLPMLETTCAIVPGSISYLESVGEEDGEGSIMLNLRTMADGTPVGTGKAEVPIESGLPVLPVSGSSQYTTVRVAYQQYIQPYNGEGWHLVDFMEDRGRTRAPVIITGERSPNPEGDDAFLVPEYFPFSVLRRPPGDKSFASFDSTHVAETTFSMQKKSPSSENSGMMGAAEGSEHSVGIAYKPVPGGAACVGMPPAMTCTDVAGSDGHIMDVGFGYMEHKFDQKDSSVTSALRVKSQVKTPSGDGLVGHGGDLFVTVAMAIKFVLMSHVSVTSTCRIDTTNTQKWTIQDSNVGALTVDEQTALETVAANPIISDSVFGQTRFKGGSTDGLVDPSMYEGNYLELQSKLRDHLARVYTSNNADNSWNTHAFLTLNDILFVRIPQLEDQCKWANDAIACLQQYDPDTCPGIEVVFSEEYGSVALHMLRLEVCSAGISGWKKTLDYVRNLETVAASTPDLAMTPQEIWTTKINSDLGLSFTDASAYGLSSPRLRSFSRCRYSFRLILPVAQ